MRILITGAAGMLGRDLRTTAVGSGHEVVALARSDLNITDAEAVTSAVRAAAPELVFNCGAWTNVDGAELEREAAVAINGTGAGNVARAAAAFGAWTVQVSSDYVFDGSKRRPYVESDPVNPISAYGSSKLAGELAVAHGAPEAHTVVRTSWLFGTGGPCFPSTITRLAAERDELTVVDDQVGCPTFTGHLARGLIDLTAGTQVPGIVHLAAGGDCSWYQFACEIVAATGSECQVKPGSTAELGRPAPRPAYSVLRTERGSLIPRLPDWRCGLGDYMSDRVLAS
jgi:dTDP-4-dehydrorhamnose reductase